MTTIDATTAIVVGLPWLLSAVTMWQAWLAGSSHRLAWAVGLGNQVLWLLWIVVAGNLGLLPMNVALFVIFGRNHLKWRRA